MLGALILWSIRLLIDEYLVKDRVNQESVYKEAVYGTIISGRFAGYASIPFLIYYAINPHPEITLQNIVSLLFAGGLYLMHYQYFFVLLKDNEKMDATWTESVGAANLVLTPFILFVFFGKTYNLIIIVGILLVTISVGVLLYRNRTMARNNMSPIWRLIAAFSFSSILSNYAYEEHESISTLILLLGFFYLGMGICGLFIYLAIPQPEKRADINSIVRAKFGFFTMSELIDLGGTFFFQLAIAVAPSVILVLAMFEFMPIVCMLCAIVCIVLSLNQDIVNIGRSQLQEGAAKTIASVLTFLGAILIIGSGSMDDSMLNLLDMVFK